MSTPDPNSPPLVTASETTATPVTNVRTHPAPPPLPSPYRAIAPIQHANPLQQAQNNPNRVPNSPHQIHHQDPSTVLYPFAPRGQGFSVRPVRLSSPLVADQSGYPPRADLAYSHRQLGPNQMETMMQFMRARNPHLSHPGSGSPVGSGPMRGIPHFLQPRVAPPPRASTSILDTGRNKNARRRDAALVLVRGRKVRITDGASLYSLTRSWLRNGAHEGTQSQRSETLKPLPKPLPLDVMEAAAPAEEPTDEDKEDEESVKELTEKDLLKRHIEKAKKVRAKLREERSRKIARYKARLALLLPHSGEQSMEKD